MAFVRSTLGNVIVGRILKGAGGGVVLTGDRHDQTKTWTVLQTILRDMSRKQYHENVKIPVLSFLICDVVVSFLDVLLKTPQPLHGLLQHVIVLAHGEP